MSYYFDELSAGNDSDGCSSSSSDEDDHDLDHCHANIVGGKNTARTRCILHADVDSFYSQVETLERNLDPSRPLAIGQKHIIVTCNYAARKAGITKLMSREKAQIKCPHMLIVEGSDLESYRRHARMIYECFRKHCKQYIPNCAVRKLHMDEMIADLSTVDDPELGTIPTITPPKDAFVYDPQSSKQQVVIVEDQTGAQSLAPNANTYLLHQSWNPKEDMLVHAKLYAVASVALQIRQKIIEETGFTVTMGVSSSPLLAKLASGLQKPSIVNVLPPGPNSRALVESMPLRKIPGVGSRTMKLLRPCLEDAHRELGACGPGSYDGNVGTRPMPHTWTCRDLLQVPKAKVVSCIERMVSNGESSSERCDHLFKLCRGEDDSEVVDDHGFAQKTLSIENSFKRGSLTTRERLLQVMDELYDRFPRLLNDRTKWSSDPNNAYPTTVRLTVRFVLDRDPRGLTAGSTRTVLKSQQSRCNGQALLDSRSDAQVSLIRSMVQPLLQSLVFSLEMFNISRINVALTNFCDVSEKTSAISSVSSTMLRGGKSQTLATLPMNSSSAEKMQFPAGRKRKTSSHDTDSISSFQNNSYAQSNDDLGLSEIPTEAKTIQLTEPSRLVKKTSTKCRIDQFFAKKSSV